MSTLTPRGVTPDRTVDRPGALWSQTAVIAGRTVAHGRARPAPMIINLLFPVLVLLMMGGLFGGAFAGSVSSYWPFVVPGVLTMAVLFGLESTMIAVGTDAKLGITDRLRSLPIRSAAVVLGRCLADLMFSVLTLSVLTATGLLLGWRWENGLGAALGAYGLLLSLRFALLWVGVWAGLKAGSPETVAAVQIMVWPLSFLSTLFVDAATMPGWLGTVAQWNPLSATASAVRDLFGNQPLPDGPWPAAHAPLLAVLWPIALTVVFAPLAARAYRGLQR